MKKTIKLRHCCTDQLLFSHTIQINSGNAAVFDALVAAKKAGVNLQGVDLSRANLEGIVLNGVDLSGANLAYVNLKGAKLSGVNLSHANLSNADMEGVNLYKANLYLAGLRSANLHDADLGRVNLSYADLTYASLRNTNLNGANLTGADLRDADLRDANLTNTNLFMVKLEGADLRYACLGDLKLTNLLTVPDLDGQLLALLEANPAALDMRNWHTCQTTHCRAGWAITLVGPAAEMLEALWGPATTGALIYAACYPNLPVPNFRASNQEALVNIRARAALATPA
jgi:uncharacterized protein YjbI with pentapeptide repeats